MLTGNHGEYCRFQHFRLLSHSRSLHRTVIFTLDSLGTSHRAAITKLSGYLQREAEDKKGIKNAVQAEGKQASVSTLI